VRYDTGQEVTVDVTTALKKSGNLLDVNMVRN
jgi:hypothetical protein